MEYKSLFKYRNIWMGFGAIWIMFYHAGFDLPFSLNYFQRLGLGGVDILLFASGIGCYYSYTRDFDYIGFMKRRIKRILPVFYVFIAIWTVYKIFFSDITLIQIIGNFSLFGYLLDLGNQFNWYISTVWIFYLAMPFVYFLFEKSKPSEKFLIILFLVLFSASFYKRSNFLFFSCRIPVFLTGCYFGFKSKNKDRISGKTIFGLIILMLIGYAWICISILKYRGTLFSIGFSFYPFMFITPGMCILISFIADFFKKHRFTCYFNKFFNFCGKLSLEIYLIHIWLFEAFEDYVKDSLLKGIILMIFTVIVSFIFSHFCKLVIKYSTRFFSYINGKFNKPLQV